MIDETLVEIHDESLVPDDVCRVIVTMTANQWRNLLAAANIPSTGKWLPPEQWTPAAKVVREVSKSAVAEALAKQCPTCNGKGEAAEYVGLEMRCVGVECPDCGGTGRCGVPGARLGERGQSVVIC